VAYLLTVVAAAFEQPSADADAYVLCLDVILAALLQLVLALGCLSLLGLLLAWTASLAALVTAAVQRRLADPEADRLAELALVTNGLAGRPAAAARDIDRLHAGCAWAGVADIGARVAARERLPACLAAARYVILAGPPWLGQELLQRRLAARAAHDHVGRERAMCWLLALWMAALLALVHAAVECATARRIACEAAVEPLTFPILRLASHVERPQDIAASVARDVLSYPPAIAL
jgi:hypothetical protein